MLPRLAILLVLGIAVGCGKTSDTTAEGYPLLRSPEDAEAAEARAQQLSSPSFAKLDQGQPLTEKDRSDLKEAARLTEGESLYDPQAYGPFWRLGQIYVATGEYDKALDRLASFIRLLPSADIELAPRLADAKFLIAQAHAGKENFPAALKELNLLLEEYPDTPEFLFLRAQCYIRLGDEPKAKRDLTRLLQKHPESAGAKLLLSQMNQKAKKGS